ncbi:MAG TPA: hypothetical protein VFJ81_03095 [Gemmatimonadales bacterium]|nr:hypothetical protein [Gemmatimonadales bacterium]
MHRFPASAVWLYTEHLTPTNRTRYPEEAGRFQRRDVGEVPNLHETSARRDEQLLRRDLDGAVQACLARLTPAQCVLLAMRDDLPVREIAKVLRYPSPFHVYRTLNTLLGGCAAVWPNEEVPGVDAAGVVHHQAPTGHGPVVGRWGGASSMTSGIFMAARR